MIACLLPIENNFSSSKALIIEVRTMVEKTTIFNWDCVNKHSF